MLNKHRPIHIASTRFKGLSAVLPILLDASADANRAIRDRWQFAVTVAELYGLGAQPTDVRWAIIEGFFRHALERHQRQAKRKFAATSSPVVCENSCFLLSDAGINLARRVLNGSRNKSHSRAKDLSIARPRWNALTRELMLGGVVVKRFRCPAGAQETILDAFEEEGWPGRISDPLDKIDGVDRNERLHNTIKRLNGCQLEAQIIFSRDGTGSGVCWKIAVQRKEPG